MTHYDEPALVVLSGGQDSTTCLFWARRHFAAVHALSFTYGQKHVLEVELARALAAKAGATFEAMDLPLVGQLGRNALTDTSIAMDEAKPAGGPPNTFVSQTDYSGYPDCRDNFVKSLNVTLNLALEAQFVIHTPLMWLDKCQTWALADELGVLDVVRRETLTCYNGIPGDGCGHCPACRLRREGLEKYLRLKGRQA